MKCLISFLFYVALSLTLFSQEKNNDKSLNDWLINNPSPEGTWIPEIWKNYLNKGIESGLHDFSFAGYHYREKEIPKVSKILGSITDFGAIPNDDIDDTENIQKALDAFKGKKGVILFPKGKYIINGDPKNPSFLKLNASNIVIRGEGSEKDGTVLYMANKYLPEKGFGDFVLNIGSEEPKYKKFGSNVIANSKKGSHYLTVESTSKFTKGDYVKVGMYSSKVNGVYNTDLSKLLTHPLEPDPKWKNFGKYAPYESLNQIVKIIDNNTLQLKTPLKIDIDTKWTPKLKKVAFYEEIGIENIRFEGAWQGPYKHHGNREMDYGWCAVEFNNSVNSWVKNVSFHNLTIDVVVSNSKNITIENVVVSGTDGHHGIKATHSSEILVKDIVFTAKRTHNIGGSGLMEGCVFTNIDIQTASGLIDFHGGGFSLANLFENIKNASVSGAGHIKNMPHSGRENTFWNSTSMQGHTRSSVLENEFFPSGVWNYHKNEKFSFDCYKLYPRSIVVGIYNTKKPVEIDKDTSDRNTDFIYLEGLNKPKVWPTSIYKEQLDIRLK